jgi:hypothetical protein
MITVKECDDWKIIEDIIKKENKKTKKELLKDIKLILEHLEGDPLKEIAHLI